MDRFAKIGSAVMGALFVYAAVVQYNDPDPLQWMIVYGVAAILCGLFLFGRLSVALTAMIVGLGVVWSAYLAFRLISQGMFFDENQMVGIAEEGREMLGLLIIVGWISFLGWRAKASQSGVSS